MINLKQMSLSQLLDLWELTETNNDINIYDVRGWLMDEIKSRNPAGVDAWLDQEEPEDKQLREFVTR